MMALSKPLKCAFSCFLGVVIRRFARGVLMLLNRAELQSSATRPTALQPGTARSLPSPALFASSIVISKR
jgi:hypothetical protein